VAAAIPASQPKPFKISRRSKVLLRIILGGLLIASLLQKLALGAEKFSTGG
jgi:hypothetical protein